tara:strand:+ start:91 stop:399 length:309 start_codon:yes stop_codon:yes gene_type:complete
MPTKSQYVVGDTNTTLLEAGTASKVKSIIFVGFYETEVQLVDIRMGSTQYICKNLKVNGGSTLIIDDPSLLTYDTDTLDLVLNFTRDGSASSTTAYVTVNWI